MSARREATGSSTGLFAGAGLLMVLCCALAPALLGAGAGSVIGGWLGILAGCLLAAGVGLGLYLRRRTRGGC